MPDLQRHARLLDLVDEALDSADIRLSSAARVRLRFMLVDIADADEVHLVRRNVTPTGDNES